MGIAEDQVEWIFRPFWRAHAADGRGLGLGLAITRGIVEAHGGRIAGREPSREGSTFSFTGPIAPEQDGLAGA